MLSTQSVKGLQIVPPKETSGAYETNDDMPKMHCVTVIVGKRAAGKSVAAINLIEKMGYDYTIAVSPTMQSNKELMNRLNIEHTFEDPDDLTTVDKIKEIVNGEARDLERYRHEMKEYNKLMSDIKSGNSLDDNMLLKFFNTNTYGLNDFVKPKHRWNGKKPRIAVIFDDMLGSLMYSRPRKINALSTYSRHLGQLEEGGSIGVSLFFLIQSFKCQTGGLNRVIRNQCTQLIVFKTKDNKELDDIADSCGGEISKEKFIEVYDYAIETGGSHAFLFIDLHKKENHPSMFRVNFDKFILVDELNKKEMNKKEMNKKENNNTIL
jgi:hypothetical protein